MSDTLIQQGTDLMLFGMGSVLVFLTLLVIATVFMSGALNRWFPEAEPPVERKGRSSSASASSAAQVDKKKLAIIKAAIEQHRARRR
ncbi:OadG family protein [Marinimicrobium agarilyticum]|uniref:OadG family protein n=1 Tax=Marinimicrobium agarilyticum TaxID=306546 RepID=UPI000416FAD5|nr:OadG family protein [Marinimicrobium agarilyticum]